MGLGGGGELISGGHLSFISWGLQLDVFFCLQVDGPITEGRAYKLRGPISSSLL